MWRPYLLHVSGGAGGAEPGVATPLRRLAEGRVKAEQVVAELALVTPTIMIDEMLYKIFFFFFLKIDC